jgi:hypothetical protein
VIYQTATPENGSAFLQMITRDIEQVRLCREFHDHPPQVGSEPNQNATSAHARLGGCF